MAVASELMRRLGVETDFEILKREYDKKCLEVKRLEEEVKRLEEEVKRLTPRKRGPMHSCDDPLCAVCGNPYA